MDKFELVDRLKNKANISYEEAKNALEMNNWDMLDAMLYLEECGKVKRPSVSIYYTNENKDNHSENEDSTNNSNDYDNNSKTKNGFESVFETICKAIDTCNNIFVEFRRNNKLLLKLPLTVIIVMAFFSFGIIIPVSIIGLFLDVEYIISAKNVEVNKANKILSNISETVKDIKEKILRGVKND